MHNHYVSLMPEYSWRRVLKFSHQDKGRRCREENIRAKELN